MGLGYNQGKFYIKDFNKVDNLKDVLSNILNEEVVFSLTCFICGKDFICLECKYYEVCLSRDLPFYCICKKCSIKNDLYDRYQEESNNKLKK